MMIKQQIELSAEKLQTGFMHAEAEICLYHATHRKIVADKVEWLR